MRTHRVDVEAGEGANVLVTSSANASFSLELVDSDVENVRVAVQSAVPTAPPTVPKQATARKSATARDATRAGRCDAVLRRSSTRERLTAVGCATCEFHAHAESLAAAGRLRRGWRAGQRAPPVATPDATPPSAPPPTR